MRSAVLAIGTLLVPQAVGAQVEVSWDGKVVTPAIFLPQTVRSGMLPSGSGSDFSYWYYLSTGPIPRGWQIVNAEFHLEGDRRCGSWANCDKVQELWNQVTWRFELQGHNEGGDVVRYSEGVLTYDLVPLPKDASTSGRR